MDTMLHREAWSERLSSKVFTSWKGFALEPGSGQSRFPWFSRAYGQYPID
jgi:hypothetical protein